MLEQQFFRILSIKVLFQYFLLIFFFSGCQRPQDELSIDSNKYLGHLKLESSTLIVTEVAGGLDVPWEIFYGSDGWLWYTELKGTINRLHPETGEKEMLFQIPDIHYVKSRGLLGMTVHNNPEKDTYVFLHYTFSFIREDQMEEIQSRLVSYTYNGSTLTDPKILLDSIPGKTFHNGSRLKISPDEKLFFSMGDIGETSLTQNIASTAGKILRLNLDGTVPGDNPFQGNPVWAWGFRNPQGLVFTSNGNLYGSDHGPINDDELNLIKKGRNYGWPNVTGFCDTDQEKKYCQDSSIVEPLKAWTPTIAVAGIDYFPYDNIPEWQNSLFLANLKGRSLRILKLNESGDAVINEHIYFQKKFGRLRDIAVAPNGDIFLATSNLDWHPRFQPFMYEDLPSGADRIIKLQKATPDLLAQIESLESPVLFTEDLEPIMLLDENWEFRPVKEHLVMGQQLYMQHCASCHRPEGQGVENLIPPLSETDWVTGDKGRLIQVLLKGLSDPIVVKDVKYEQEMPSFAHLSDEQIANVLSYIRQSFGNDESAVIAGEVFEERKGI